MAEEQESSFYEDPVLMEVARASALLPQLPHPSLKSAGTAESTARGWSYDPGWEMGDGIESLVGFHLGPWGTDDPLCIPPHSHSYPLLNRWQPWGHLTQIHGAPSAWQRQRSNWF